MGYKDKDDLFHFLLKILRIPHAWKHYNPEISRAARPIFTDECFVSICRVFIIGSACNATNFQKRLNLLTGSKNFRACELKHMRISYYPCFRAILMNPFLDLRVSFMV